jgi:hypothetical protein
MNIFALDTDPIVAARMHCDKHIVKMVSEYAQLLSTAHRVLDGKLETLTYQHQTTIWTDMADTGGAYVHGRPGPIKTRTKKFYTLPGESISLEHVFLLEDMETKYVIEVKGRKCMTHTHINHPCAVWARENEANYEWLNRLFAACLLEYTRRYGRTHAIAKFAAFLRKPPANINRAVLSRDEFVQTMPDEYKVPNDPVAAYQAFYVGSKARFARWTNTPVPEWFQQQVEDYDASRFERTR